MKPIHLAIAGLVSVATFIQASGETLVASESSVGPGERAVFRSGGPIRFETGFEVRGGSVEFRFGNGLEKKSTLPEAKVSPTTLNRIVFQNDKLTLNYSLREAASVSVEVFEATGRVLGKWTWQEGSGLRSTDLQWKRPVGSHAFFVRWTTGSQKVVRKVVILK